MTESHWKHTQIKKLCVTWHLIASQTHTHTKIWANVCVIHHSDSPFIPLTDDCRFLLKNKSPGIASISSRCVLTLHTHTQFLPSSTLIKAAWGETRKLEQEEDGRRPTVDELRQRGRVVSGRRCNVLDTKQVVLMPKPTRTTPTFRNVHHVFFSQPSCTRQQACGKHKQSRPQGSFPLCSSAVSFYSRCIRFLFTSWKLRGWGRLTSDPGCRCICLVFMSVSGPHVKRTASGWIQRAARPGAVVIAGGLREVNTWPAATLGTKHSG